MKTATRHGIPHRNRGETRLAQNRVRGKLQLTVPKFMQPKFHVQKPLKGVGVGEEDYG